MKSLSKSNSDDPQFTKQFWKAIAIAIGFSMFTAVSLVVMGLLAYFGQKYNF
jgi:multidrug efflux pump subunit AcrB